MIIKRGCTCDLQKIYGKWNLKQWENKVGNLCMTSHDTYFYDLFEDPLSTWLHQKE